MTSSIFKRKKMGQNDFPSRLVAKEPSLPYYLLFKFVFLSAMMHTLYSLVGSHLQSLIKFVTCPEVWEPIKIELTYNDLITDNLNIMYSLTD